MSAKKWKALEQSIIECRACDRLVAHREDIARIRRRAYRNETYWGRPVPGFGDRKARLVVVGLAPGAHGANRTGRMFTGDRSGEFLYAGLFRAGFANQPHSISRDDGLTLKDAFILAPVRCAPPDNKPTPEEFRRCAHFMTEELALVPARIFLCLGALAWNATFKWFEETGGDVPVPRPVFSHGAQWQAPDGRWVFGCYHVSQQNTQTGRLTEAMFDEVLKMVRNALFLR